MIPKKYPAFAVRYTDQEDGKRKILNGIAFSSRMEADKELKRVLGIRHGLTQYELKLLREAEIKIPAELIGKYFRVKQIKIQR